MKTLENIYNCFESSNARKAVDLINQEDLYQFWHDYRSYLDRLYENKVDALFVFSEHVIMYHRVMHR